MIQFKLLNSRTVVLGSSFGADTDERCAQTLQGLRPAAIAASEFGNVLLLAFLILLANSHSGEWKTWECLDDTTASPFSRFEQAEARKALRISEIRNSAG
jgi:hypothetical protein